MNYYKGIEDIPSAPVRYQCHCENGECSNCGECCTDMLPMTDAELREIKRYAQAHHLKENHRRLFLDPNATDFTCPFRNNEKRICEIYPVRPEICRSFICSKSLETAHAERDQIYVGRKERSLRYEIFGNTEVLELIRRTILARMLKNG